MQGTAAVGCLTLQQPPSPIDSSLCVQLSSISVAFHRRGGAFGGVVSVWLCMGFSTTRRKGQSGVSQGVSVTLGLLLPAVVAPAWTERKKKHVCREAFLFSQRSTEDSFARGAKTDSLPGKGWDSVQDRLPGPVKPAVQTCLCSSFPRVDINMACERCCSLCQPKSNE